ncbi:PIN domain-containing protein [Falsiroseomonas sp. HW251]|uniref:tetratricopeptide repeat protein n=1 Tax=Falsiroseomonas sp. HW251 TaxID=3390998 RepID=UPI003D31CE2B
MSIQNQQLAPPANWQDFEKLCHDLYQEIWGDPQAVRHGRTGQPQAGVDIYGHDKKGRFTGVQCKGKDGGLGAELTEKELRDEVEKAKTFRPLLDVFILATSAPPDIKIQQVARDIDDAHKTIGIFRVHVIAWDTLQLLLQKHPEVAERQLGQVSTAKILNRIDVSDARGEERHEERHAEMMLAIQKVQSIAVAALPRPGTDQGGDPAEESLRTRIKDAAELGNEGNARAALVLLNSIRQAEWGTASPRSRHRILNALGFVHLALGSRPLAVQHLREASAADPGRPWSIAAFAFAEMLEDSNEAAFAHAKDALSADPTLENAAVTLVHAAPDDLPLPDLLSTIPEALREKPQVLLALVDAARDRNDWDEALRLAENAYARDPDDWRSQGSLASELLRPVLAIREIAVTKAVPHDLAGRFRRGLDLARQAWNTVATNDYGARMPELALNLSGALMVQGDEDAARDVLHEALRLTPDNAEIHNRLSMILSGRGKLADALSHLESVPEDKREESFDVIRLHLLLGMRRYVEAREAASRLASELPPGEDRDAAAGVALEAEIALGAGSETVVAALDAFPDAMPVRSAALRFRDLPADLAERLRLDAERGLTRATSARDIFAAAEVFRATGQPARAAEILAPFTVPDRDTHALRTRLECLIEADSRREARELFESLSPSLHNLRRYVDFGVKIYDMVGLLTKARRLLQAYLEKTPDDLRARIVWFGLCERTAAMSKALDWLRSVPSAITGDADDLIVLARLIDRHLADLKCLTLGYRALRQGFDDPQIHLSYAFGLFLMGRATKTAKLEPETAGPDTAVVLAECDGPARIVRVIETELGPRIERNEVPPSDALASRLTGLRVGDEVTIASYPHGDVRYRIESIRSKYLHAHFDVLEHFRERFPEAAGFGTVEIGDDTDQNRFDAVFRMARERAERLREIEAAYKAGRISMAHLALACGCSALDVWDDYRWRKDPTVLAAVGSEPERAEAMRRLIVAKTCVLDPLSIYAATTLGIAETLRDCFQGQRLSVTQTTLDYLLEVALEREREAETGHRGSLGWEGDHPTMVEVGPDALRMRASWAQQALAFARTCEIVPAESHTTVRPDASGIYTALPRAALDSVLAAIGSEGVLLCEDMPLRRLGEIASEVKGVWVQALLRWGLLTGRISPERYSAAVGRLVDAGHLFTSIGPMELLHELRRQSWMPIGRVSRYLALLAAPNNDRTSQTGVVAEFLETAWLETGGDYRFRTVLSQLLAAFVARHPNPLPLFSDWMVNLRNRLARQRFGQARRTWLLRTTSLAGVKMPPIPPSIVAEVIEQEVVHCLLWLDQSAPEVANPGDPLRASLGDGVEGEPSQHAIPSQTAERGVPAIAADGSNLGDTPTTPAPAPDPSPP